MDIAGQRIASLEKKDKFYKIAESELKKTSNVVLIDELVDEEFMTNELKDKVVALMEDPGKIVIASMKNSKKMEEFGFLDYIKQQKHLETFNLDHYKNPKEVEDTIFKKMKEMPEKAEELANKFHLESF
jgi:nucleoside-triphosphatase THEP1